MFFLWCYLLVFVTLVCQHSSVPQLRHPLQVGNLFSSVLSYHSFAIKKLRYCKFVEKKRMYFCFKDTLKLMLLLKPVVWPVAPEMLAFCTPTMTAVTLPGSLPSQMMEHKLVSSSLNLNSCKFYHLCYPV